MNDKLAESFGLVIAYVCPGLLALWGLSAVTPVVEDLTRIGGGFVLVLIAAAGLGVLLSGLRLLVFEKLLLEKVVKLPHRAEDFEDALRRVPGAESAYRDIRSSFFPYYQFFSHMLVLAPFLFAAWIVHSAPSLPDRIVAGLGLVVASAVLYVNAIYSLTRLYQRRQKLLEDIASRVVR